MRVYKTEVVTKVKWLATYMVDSPSPDNLITVECASLDEALNIIERRRTENWTCLHPIIFVVNNMGVILGHVNLD